MICNNCGTNYENDRPCCPACGTTNPQPTYQQSFEQPVQQPYQQGGYQQPYQQPYQQDGYQPYYNPQQEALNQSQISSAQTLGIVSIVCAVLGLHLVSWICGGIGISKMKQVLAMSPNNPAALSSKKLCKIGVIVSIVLYVLTMIGVFIAMSLGAFAFVEGSGILDEIYMAIMM